MSEATATVSVQDEYEVVPLPNTVTAVFGLLRPSTLAEVIVTLESADDYDTFDLRENAMQILVENVGHTEAAKYITEAAQ